MILKIKNRVPDCNYVNCSFAIKKRITVLLIIIFIDYYDPHAHSLLLSLFFGRAF